MTFAKKRRRVLGGENNISKPAFISLHNQANGNQKYYAYRYIFNNIAEFAR